MTDKRDILDKACTAAGLGVERAQHHLNDASNAAADALWSLCKASNGGDKVRVPDKAFELADAWVKAHESLDDAFDVLWAACDALDAYDLGEDE